jgi:hypothetical protein
MRIWAVRGEMPRFFEILSLSFGFSFLIVQVFFIGAVLKHCKIGPGHRAHVCNLPAIDEVI